MSFDHTQRREFHVNREEQSAGLDLVSVTIIIK